MGGLDIRPGRENSLAPPTGQRVFVNQGRQLGRLTVVGLGVVQVGEDEIRRRLAVIGLGVVQVGEDGIRRPLAVIGLGVVQMGEDEIPERVGIRKIVK